MIILVSYVLKQELPHPLPSSHKSFLLRQKRAPPNPFVLPVISAPCAERASSYVVTPDRAMQELLTVSLGTKASPRRLGP